MKTPILQNPADFAKRFSLTIGGPLCVAWLIAEFPSRYAMVSTTLSYALALMYLALHFGPTLCSKSGLKKSALTFSRIRPCALRVPAVTLTSRPTEGRLFAVLPVCRRRGVFKAYRLSSNGV
jgi:hypothetical protein